MIDDDSYGEEENEETYIDPNDLIIIPKQSESMWEPTEGQIQAYALKLQMNPETDPPEVIDIAYKYLTEQLPEEWTRAFTKDRLELLYINLETNEIQLETDLEMAARQEYEEYMELIKEQNERDNAKVTVVPRKKIETIGSKQNQKNEKENESSNKKSKSASSAKNALKRMGSKSFLMVSHSSIKGTLKTKGVPLMNNGVGLGSKDLVIKISSFV